MTLPTVADLLVSDTEDEIEATQLAVIAAANFPVTSWASNSVPMTLVKADVRTTKKVSDQVPEIVKGGFVKTSTGQWLDLLAESQFDELRREAAFTTRTLRITDTGGAPVTKAAGMVWIEMANGLAFKNVAPFTVPTVPGFVDVSFSAEMAGSAYNASTSAWRYITPVTGTTIAELPGGLPTITVNGTDVEDDVELSTRLPEKWSTLGAGATDDAYAFHAKAARDEVTRVSVFRHTPAGGDVTLYLAGDGGAILAGDVLTDVEDYVEQRAPNVATIFVESATNATIVLTGTVFAIAGELAAAKVAAEASLDALSNRLPIAGLGASYSNPLELIAEQIMRALTDDVRNDLDLTAPVADYVITPGQVPVINYAALVWTPV